MKEPVRWTIDEEIVESLKEKAEKEDRSVSYIVNEILKKEKEKKIK